jgi:tetratricopeptide (TPR) repeat protein
VPQTKQPTKRQLIEQARQVALEGNWDQAIELNRALVERSPRAAEAHNRLGRAFLALRRYSEATEAYSNALRADPANLIARRNLQRLELVRHRAGNGGRGDEGAPLAPLPRTAVFIEEVGKTWVDELVNPAAREEMAEIFPDEPLALEVEGERLIVKRRDGLCLGEIESKTAERVIALIAGGNRYEIYALGMSQHSLRVILREVFRDPALATRISFPRQITSRAYLRERDLLRSRDEADFFLMDDEDEEEEEEEAAGPDHDEEEGVEPDAEQFIEDAVAAVEEEEASL